MSAGRRRRVWLVEARRAAGAWRDACYTRAFDETEAKRLACTIFREWGFDLAGVEMRARPSEAFR